jgi:hypothetical protein
VGLGILLIVVIVLGKALTSEVGPVGIPASDLLVVGVVMTVSEEDMMAGQLSQDTDGLEIKRRRSSSGRGREMARHGIIGPKCKHSGSYSQQSNSTGSHFSRTFL